MDIDRFASHDLIKKVTIICPVYNEIRTAESTLNKLLDVCKEFADYEIIIVESNSTDGTREIIDKFRDYKKIKIILQDKPEGKGSAIKKAISSVTGDLVAIQDLDDEYEPTDLIKLAKEIEKGYSSFVIGSRHVDSKQIRKFDGQPLLSKFFNLGHQIFKLYFNLLFGSELTDPFSMHKVMRIEVLRKFTLHSDRFDIDWEILGKSIRVGARPVELPINYKSRSLKDGKKVKLFTDPLNWTYRALVIRFSRLELNDRKKK
jgi:glycosyltransferase involved in cell wall biosynthesis